MGVRGTHEVSCSATGGLLGTDITRSFSSVSQAARKRDDSPVCAGIYLRSACEDGLVLGRRIGPLAAAMYLQPVHN